MGNLEEAIACFEQACTISDNEAGIHYQLGILYLEANKVEQAAQEWRKALQIDPTLQSAKHLLNRYGG